MINKVGPEIKISRNVMAHSSNGVSIGFRERESHGMATSLRLFFPEAVHKTGSGAGLRGAVLKARPLSVWR